MNQQSYDVDSRKGAANVNNPYDFKNVQVSLKLYIHILKMDIYFMSNSKKFDKSFFKKKHTHFLKILFY